MNKKNCCVFFMTVLFSVNAFALVAPNVKYLPAGNSFNSYNHLFETQVKGQALEATARTNFMANGKGIEQLNVTYNGGKNGLANCLQFEADSSTFQKEGLGKPGSESVSH